MARGMFWTCPICGSNLDPGEKCECQKERAIAEASMPVLRTEEGGQLTWLEGSEDACSLQAAG